MLKKPSDFQTELEMVRLDSLVPSDHLLRKIDTVIDFRLSMNWLKGFTALIMVVRR